MVVGARIDFKKLTKILKNSDKLADIRIRMRCVPKHKVPDQPNPDYQSFKMTGEAMKFQNFRQCARILFVLCMVFGLMACGSDSMVGQLWGQMSELFKVKQAIDESLVEGEAAIEIQNDRVITLGLVNTEYNDVGAEEREKAAGNILNILLEQIKAKEEFKNVDKVVVNFIHHETKFLVVDITMTVDYYEYNI